MNNELNDNYYFGALNDDGSYTEITKVDELAINHPVTARNKFDENDEQCKNCEHCYWCELCNDFHCDISLYGNKEDPCEYKEML